MKDTKLNITKKEKDVLVWVQRALSNKQIAREMHLAESTIKMHVGNLIRKYGVQNRTQLSAFSLQGKSVDLNAYLPKDLESNPVYWALRKGEKILAISFQKAQPSPDWEGAYIRRKNEDGESEETFTSSFKCC